MSDVYLDILGHCNPMYEKAEFSAPLVYSWLLEKALPTEFLLGMLVKAKTLNTKWELLDIGYTAEMI